jgi:hypothetical protein
MVGVTIADLLDNNRLSKKTISSSEARDALDDVSKIPILQAAHHQQTSFRQYDSHRVIHHQLLWSRTGNPYNPV